MRVRALLLLLLVVGFSCVSLLWDGLRPFSLSNPEHVFGPIVRDGLDPKNNQFRFALYVFAPTILFAVFWGVFWGRRSWKWGTEHFLPASPTLDPRQDQLLYWSAWTVLWTWGIWKASRAAEFPGAPSPFDAFNIFHHSEYLVAGINHRANGGYWSTSYLVHGLIYDLATVIGSWNGLHADSIGAMRVGLTTLCELVFLGIVGWIGLTAMEIRRERGPLLGALWIFCLLFSFIMTSGGIDIEIPAWLSFHLGGNWQFAERRDLISLLALGTTLAAVLRSSRGLGLLAGLLGVLAFLYANDRGIYCAIAGILLLPLDLLLLKNSKTRTRTWFFWIAGWIAGFALTGLVLGFSELLSAFKNVMWLARTHDLVNGFIYPAPAFPITNLRRLMMLHTLPLVLMGALVLSLSVEAFCRGRSLKGDREFVVQTWLCICALVFYRSALGRVDDLHIQYSGILAFSCLGVLMYRGLRRAAPQTLRAVLLTALVISVLAHTVTPRLSEIWPRIQKLAQFLPTAKTIANIPDDHFLTPEMRETRDFLRTQFTGERCLLSLVSEPIWNYLLKLPSCGPYHTAWIISAEHQQREMIADFEKAQPKRALIATPSGNDQIDGIPLSTRMPLVWSYIQEHYRRRAEKGGWVVLERL